MQTLLCVFLSCFNILSMDLGYYFYYYLCFLCHKSCHYKTNVPLTRTRITCLKHFNALELVLTVKNGGGPQFDNVFL